MLSHNYTTTQPFYGSLDFKPQKKKVPVYAKWKLQILSKNKKNELQ